MNKTIIERESSFELIRVIAQYFIVLYHLLLKIVYDTTNIEFYRAMWLPLHIGVPLFVMISGYFGIKTDLKRLIKLVGMVFVLQVPLLAVETTIGGGSFMDYLKLVFFVSNTPFWFIRTYLLLFLFAPVINLYLKKCTSRQRIFLLLVLLFMTIYIGTLKFDLSLNDGKNLVSFMFYYVIGDTLHLYEDKWKTFPRKYLFTFYIVFNVALVAFFSFYGKNRIVSIIFNRVFFEYTSVGLLLNSIIFFMLVGGMRFKSKFVNSIGKSSLAIYMIHGSPIVIYRLLPPIVMSAYWMVNEDIFFFFFFLLLITALIVILCWLTYLALTPIWTLIGKIGDYAQNKCVSYCKF